MGGRFLGGLTQYPTPLGTGCVKGIQDVTGASAVHFGKNFIKQKLQYTPDLVGEGYLFGPQILSYKDLCPISFWSHGHSLWRGVYKIQVVMFITNSYLVWFVAP